MRSLSPSSNNASHPIIITLITGRRGYARIIMILFFQVMRTNEHYRDAQVLKHFLPYKLLPRLRYFTVAFDHSTYMHKLSYENACTIFFLKSLLTKINFQN
jgi:hypothetical protein